MKSATYAVSELTVSHFLAIAPLRLMPRSFPNIGNAAEFVGQTPWSARDALVPLSARRINALHATMADEGVGRGRGRPPYNLRRWPAMGKLCGIALTVAALTGAARVSKRSRDT